MNKVLIYKQSVTDANVLRSKKYIIVCRPSCSYGSGRVGSNFMNSWSGQLKVLAQVLDESHFCSRDSRLHR